MLAGKAGYCLCNKLSRRAASQSAKQKLLVRSDQAIFSPYLKTTMVSFSFYCFQPIDALVAILNLF